MYVYIMTNPLKTVLYTGVTNNLQRRVLEHRAKMIEGFTKRYNVTWLLYYEEIPDPESAIAREKQIKSWSRAKKEELIARTNPLWVDLAASLEDDGEARPVNGNGRQEDCHVVASLLLAMTAS